MASNKIGMSPDKAAHDSENAQTSENVRISEAELVRLSIEGDRGAFGRLVERTQDRIYNLAFRLTGQHHGALDLSQEAFTRALAAMPRFRGESGFFTWMYRIVMNLHMNRERSLAAKAEKRTFALDPVSRHENNPPAVDVAERKETDPSLPLQKQERDAAIQNALLELATDQRQVVLLRDMEGLAYEEIADVLEVPVGTVKSRLHRARGELKVKLKGIV